MWRVFRAAFLAVLLSHLIACNAVPSFNIHNISEVSDTPCIYITTCHADPMPWLHDVASMVPFLAIQHVELRRVWSGMRGGHFGSVPCGRHYLGHAYFAYDGGAHDSAVFIWTQLVVSGLHPHPGPPTNTTPTTSPTAGPKPLRVNSSAGALCLYEVYAHLSPNTQKHTSNASHTLRHMSNRPEFIVQWLKRSCSFETTESMPAGSHNRQTPSILSFQELDDFIHFMQGRYQTTRMRNNLVLCQGNVRSFYRRYTPKLQTLWPDSSPVPFVPQSPVPLVSKSTTTAKPSVITRPLPEVMKKASEVLGVAIVPSIAYKGVYTTEVPLSKVDLVVEVVGIYTQTKFSKRTTSNSSLRFECYRGSVRTLKDPKSKLEEKADVTKKTLRPNVKTNKCDCVAKIIGTLVTTKESSSKVPSTHDAPFTLTLDLRHSNHRIGTNFDSRLLPLLPAVLEKLDQITRIVRNKTLVRKILSEYLKTLYFPTTHPSIQWEDVHPLDGRFFPTDPDIKNSIARSGKALQLASSDQESTLRYFASLSGLSWVMRPCQGATTVYVYTPSRGLRPTRVDGDMKVHYMNPVGDVTSSTPDVTAKAMALYAFHLKMAPIKVEARHSPSCDHNEVNDGLDGIPNILWRKEKLYNMCKRLGGCLKGSKEVLFQNITVILASTRADRPTTKTPPAGIMRAEDISEGASTHAADRPTTKSPPAGTMGAEDISEGASTHAADGPTTKSPPTGTMGAEDVCEGASTHADGPTTMSPPAGSSLAEDIGEATSTCAGTSPASAAKAVEEELSADIKIGIHALNKSSPIALNARGGTLLLAMTKDQERMLERYGHITCIDATYKVVQWGLPFSMLVVVNEHQQAFPVAYFMLQHETEQAITEVLLLIKDMVPKWNPRCMIMDKDQAEINACTSVFPNVTIILCEFHAKQAWLRWLRTSAHGVPKEMQLRVYKLMGSIMKSPTPAVAESRVTMLECVLRGAGKDLSRCVTWFVKEWKPCIHQWCPAFYGHVFTRSFTTNNYVEGLNHALKSMLILRPNLRTDSLWVVVMEDFTPKYVQRHLQSNLESADPSRSFTQQSFPKEFGLRPLRVLRALRNRQTSANDIPASGVEDLEGGNFRFQKGKKVLRAEYELDQYTKRAAMAASNSDPPLGTSDPPTTTCEPPSSTSDPPTTTTEPLSSTFDPPTTTFAPPSSTSAPPSSTSPPTRTLPADSTNEELLREMEASLIADPHKAISPMFRLVLKSRGWIFDEVDGQQTSCAHAQPPTTPSLTPYYTPMPMPRPTTSRGYMPDGAFQAPRPASRSATECMGEQATESPHVAHGKQPTSIIEDCTCKDGKECDLCLLMGINDCWRMDEEEATVDRNERVAAEVEEEQWEDATCGVATSAEAGGDDVPAVGLDVEDNSELDDEDMHGDARASDSFAEYLSEHKGSEHHTYLVSVTQGTCTCPDRVVSGYICKHLFKALDLSNQSFTSLPEHVRNAAHLTIDYEVIAADHKAAGANKVCEWSDDDDMEQDWEAHKTFERSSSFDPATTDLPSTSTPAATERDKTAELSEDKGMIADKQMLIDLKNITSIVHDGPLKDENAKIRAQQAMSNVLSELIAIAKEQHVEQDMHAADLPQKGKKKRQRHGTEQQGSNAPSSSTMDAAAEYSQKKSRGRPQENASALPSYASVDWAKLMKSGNIKDV